MSHTKNRGSGDPATSSRDCSVCGTAFTPKSHNSAVCSPACGKRRDNTRRKAEFATEQCITCGSEFVPYKGDQKNCSRACGVKAERAKKRIAAAELFEDDEPAERTDEQMSRLFRDYHSRDSITIPEREDGTRCVVISDAQIPFMDEPMWEAFLRFLGKYRPHDLFINGDWLDCYEASDFDKRPHRLFDLSKECDMAKDTLRDMRKRLAVGGKIWWADGNHEERWNKAIWRHAGPLAAFTADLYTALDLEHLVDGYVPYGKHFDYLGFLITHGNFVSQFSAYTARKHYDRYHSSGCNGHTHRVGSYSHTDGKGRSHTWYEIGCFCRRDLEYVKGTANWQHGFLIGEVRGEAYHPQLVRVIETDAGRGFFAGGEFWPIFD